MIPLSYRLTYVLATAFTLGLSVGASAIDMSGSSRQDISEAERKMAPPYCRYTMSEKGWMLPERGKWVGIMGEGFSHMHHHCWALYDFRRAERADLSAAEKKFLRSRALGGFLYVARNTREDFILRPEIYTWIGRTQILLDRPKEARDAFNKAQTLKPDYWPAYYHWAEFLQRRGNKSDALEVVKSGLQYSPDAKSLLLLFRHLGGKPSDLPKPILPLETAPTTESESTKSTPDLPESVSQ